MSETAAAADPRAPEANVVAEPVAPSVPELMGTTGAVPDAAGATEVPRPEAAESPGGRHDTFLSTW